MRRFDVKLGGQVRTGLTEEEVEVLYRRCDLHRDSACREMESTTWRLLDDCLPLLKYVPQGLGVELSAKVFPRLEPVIHPFPVVDECDRRKPAMTSSVKAGWICFALGAAIAWIFPPAYLFYSVALIMATVAMCTHQVEKGLILLLASFVGMGASALISLFLAVGIFAAAVGPAVEKAERSAQAQSNALQQSDASVKRNKGELLRAAEEMRKLNPSVSVPHPTRPQTSVPMSLGTSSEPKTKRQIFAELARIDTMRRQLRSQGRDLNAATQAYLERLQVEYDHASE